MGRPAQPILWGMARSVHAIGAVADPAGRAKEAHEALREMDERRSQLVDIRRGAVRELRDAGWSWQAVAVLLDIHRNRAAHLLDRHPPRPNSG